MGITLVAIVETFEAEEIELSQTPCGKIGQRGQREKVGRQHGLLTWNFLRGIQKQNWKLFNMNL